ncbi:MAG: hypothetical protein FWC50_06795 [Planctomycetaceae bacterium]|nr:hypothetical protein [Planctomycetaceae bacterium]
MKVFNAIGIAILITVILALCVWRATTNHLTYWSPIDYIGIIGFGITLFTAWKVFFINQDVQKLSNRYLLKQRLPEQIEDLEKISFELENHYRVTEENISKIRDLVARIYAISDNIVNLVQGQDCILGLNEVIQTCRNIHTKRSVPGTIRIPLGKSVLSGDDVIDLHGDLKLLIHGLKQRNKNMEKVVT